MFDERVPGATERVLDLGEEIMRLCVDAGGSITGEHGVGYEKRNYMSWIFSEDDLEVMARLKTAFGADESLQPRQDLPDVEGLRRSLLPHAGRDRQSRPGRLRIAQHPMVTPRQARRDDSPVGARHPPQPNTAASEKCLALAPRRRTTPFPLILRHS